MNLLIFLPVELYGGDGGKVPLDFACGSGNGSQSARATQICLRKTTLLRHATYS